MDVRSVGVKKELLLVEPETGHPRAVAGAILRVVTAAAAATVPQRSQLAHWDRFAWGVRVSRAGAGNDAD
jgi:hypothetical protein